MNGSNKLEFYITKDCQGQILKFIGPNRKLQRK